MLIDGDSLISNTVMALVAASGYPEESSVESVAVDMSSINMAVGVMVLVTTEQ